MMRPLPLAACLALVATLSVVAAVTAQVPATPEPAPATAAPAAASDTAPAAPAPLVGNAEAGRTLTYDLLGSPERLAGLVVYLDGDGMAAVGAPDGLRKSAVCKP